MLNAPSSRAVQSAVGTSRYKVDDLALLQPDFYYNQLIEAKDFFALKV